MNYQALITDLLTDKDHATFLKSIEFKQWQNSEYLYYPDNRASYHRLTKAYTQHLDNVCDYEVIECYA